jgi:hypothetical protein
MRTRIAAALVASLAALCAGPGIAQNFAGLGAAAASGTLDYQRARSAMPRLAEVTFEKADANGDGLISPQELPTLESIYRTLYIDR